MLKLNLSRFTAALVLAASVISCAEQQNSLQTMASGSNAHAPNNTLVIQSQGTLKVIDQDGKPIAGALIMIGFEHDNPFAGNVVQTDLQGRTALPPDWKTALPMTVEAPGYITSTIPVALPGDYDLQLQKQEGSTEFEIKGTTDEFGRLVSDGKVDFGLVLPALARENLLGFDLATVISPQIDVITILGNDVEIPSNITLPRQRETYVFPITLDKPQYRVYTRQTGNSTLSAIHGQFPLQRVVSDVRDGKSMFELINHFTFKGGGQKSLDVKGNEENFNIAVNQMVFQGQISVQAPAFAADRAVISMALREQNGLLMPTDVKRLTSGQPMNLKTVAANAPSAVLSLMLENTEAVLAPLIDIFKPWLDLEKSASARTSPGIRAQQDFNKLSFVLAENGSAPSFLPLITKPTVQNNVINTNVPQLPAGLVPAAMYLSYSEVEKVGSGKLQSERRTRLWEVWTPDWTAQIELPNVQFPQKPDRIYRWEVMFMARPANFVGDLSPTQRVDLKTITHVTRNSVDI